MKTNRLGVCSVIFLSTLVLFSCSKPPVVEPKQMAIRSLVAAPTTVEYNGTTIVSWEVTDVSAGVTITLNGKTVSASGSTSVSLQNDSTFTLQAGSLSKQVAVQVNKKAPGAPTNTAEPGDRKATVTIVASSQQGSTPTSGYTVTALLKSSGAAVKTVDVATAGSMEVTGLTNGETYVFTTVAKSPSGNSASSAQSNEVIPRTIWMEKINFGGKPCYLVNHEYFKDNIWKPFILETCDKATKYSFGLNLICIQENPTSCQVNGVRDKYVDKYTISDDGKTLNWLGNVCTITILDNTTLQFTYDGGGLPIRKTYKIQ